jgi:hypothetical protein
LTKRNFNKTKRQGFGELSKRYKGIPSKRTAIFLRSMTKEVWLVIVFDNLLIFSILIQAKNYLK